MYEYIPYAVVLVLIVVWMFAFGPFKDAPKVAVLQEGRIHHILSFKVADPGMPFGSEPLDQYQSNWYNQGVRVGASIMGIIRRSSNVPVFTICLPEGLPDALVTSFNAGLAISHLQLAKQGVSRANGTEYGLRIMRPVA